MSISDLYDNEFKDRNKGHFSAIVRVALSDDQITKEEQRFLDKLAFKLGISSDDYKEILKQPNKYPINPPVLYTRRIERLYDLSRMVFADDQLGSNQRSILTRLALALGFTPGNVEYIVDKALILVRERVSLDEFAFEIKNMNK